MTVDFCLMDGLNGGSESLLKTPDTGVLVSGQGMSRSLLVKKDLVFGPIYK